MQIPVSDIAAVVGAGSVVIAAWVGLREYRLKSAAQRVEVDVKLSELLTALIPTANGWGNPVVSDSAAGAIAEARAGTADAGELREALEAAVITPPVGEATQAAAISSIGNLGARHEPLRDAARQALLALDFVDGRPPLQRARQTALEKIESARD